MKKAIVYIISAILVFGSTYVATASDIQYESLNFDYSQNAVDISEKVCGAAGDVVSVSIANQAKGTVFSKTNTPDVFNAYVLNSEGSIGEDIVFPDNLLSGRYNIFVNGASGQKSFYTIYRNENDEATVNLINDINSAADSISIKTIVYTGSNREILGIDRENEYLAAYLESFCDSSAAVREALGGEFTSVSFYNSFCEYIVCQLFAAGEADYAVKNYESYLGTTYELFSSLEDEVKKDALLRLKDIKYITYTDSKPSLTNLAQEYSSAVSLAKKAYSDACILAEIVASSEWSDMQTLILANKDTLELDTTNYDAIKKSLKYQVFTAMCDERADYSDLSDVKKSFEDVCLDVQQSQSASSKPSSPGGSPSAGRGLSGFSADVGYTPPLQNTADDTSTENTMIFTDIIGHYSEEFVYRMAQRGVINGYDNGTFVPEGNATRAEFAKMISVLFNINTSENKNAFDDVKSDDWYSKYVAALSKTGIIVGHEGKFSPYENITRQDAALICYRVLKHFGIEISGDAGFDDKEQVSAYAFYAVSALASHGVIIGNNNQFMPHDNITRGDSAIIFCRLFDLYSASINK